MDSILDVSAWYEPKSVKIYNMAICLSQMEGICSLPNPAFKTRPLVGSIPVVAKGIDFFIANPLKGVCHECIG